MGVGVAQQVKSVAHTLRIRYDGVVVHLALMLFVALIISIVVLRDLNAIW